MYGVVHNSLCMYVALMFMYCTGLAVWLDIEHVFYCQLMFYDIVCLVSVCVCVSLYVWCS